MDNDSTILKDNVKNNLSRDLFTNNVIVGKIIEYLADYPINLYSLMLVNKTFNYEIICFLKSINCVKFYDIPKKKYENANEDDNDEDGYETDSTQPSLDDDYFFTNRCIAFNGIICYSKRSFLNNLYLLTKYSKVILLDFSFVNYYMDWKPLMTITALERLIFPVMEMFRLDWSCLDELIKKNQKNLKELRHPEYGFINNFDIGSINMDLLETDFRATRPFSSIETYVHEVHYNYEKKLSEARINELILNGHNRVRYREMDKFIIDNKKKIKFIPVDEDLFSDDLYLFKQWKLQQWKFPKTEEITFILTNLILLEVNEIVTLICTIFNSLKKLEIISNFKCTQDEIVKLIIEINKYCCSNYIDVEKTITIHGAINKKQKNHFLKRLSILERIKEVNGTATDNQWHIKIRTDGKYDILIFIYL